MDCCNEICRKINELKEALNKSISENRSYDQTYCISTDLDELINEFYRNEHCRKKLSNM